MTYPSKTIVLNTAFMAMAAGCVGNGDKVDGLDSGQDDTGTEVEGDPGLAILGGNTHSSDSVSMTELIGADQLSHPMDLAFNPSSPGELWIVNQSDHSMSIITDADTDDWSAISVSDSSGAHFMAKPASLAFGEEGRLATIHEEDQTTPFTGSAPGNFMGPTLWPSSTLSFDAGHTSHLDMLHNSPNGVGIAWDSGSVYWVFDGYYASLTRYDFGDDHGGGGSDHSDADVLQYAAGEVGYAPGVVSHMVLAPETGLLYIADTGNGRLAVLDTSTGTVGGQYGPNYDGGSQATVSGSELSTLVDGAEAGLQMPSGIALHEDMLFVVDHATSFIWAFDLDGEIVDWLETGIAPNSLMGIEIDTDGRIYIADALSNRVMRIAAL
jgi:hypothetical protein